jgi:hypothetical protein
MTAEEIRHARKSFVAQLTSMIRDFERQTGATVQAVNVERESYKQKCRCPEQCGAKTVSLFKGVFVYID